MDIPADTGKRWAACYCRDRYQIFKETKENDNMVLPWGIINKHISINDNY